MDERNGQSRLHAIEMHTRRLERRLKFTIYGWMLTLLMLPVSVWTLRPLAAQQPKPQADVLRVRQLIVVDEKGANRIVIGAPIPDPQVRGKRLKRRSPGTGIMFNDANGDERLGLGMLDDGSAVLGIDDELGQERAHVYYIPKRGTGLLLQGEKGNEKISLLIPSQGERSGGPKLEFTDRAGTTTVAIPAQK